MRVEDGVLSRSAQRNEEETDMFIGVMLPVPKVSMKKQDL